MPQEPEPTTPPAGNQPDNATKIHPVVEFLWKEWRVLKSPSFWIAVGIAAIGIFFVDQWHYGGTLAEKDATITAVTAEKDSFKETNDRLSTQNAQLQSQVIQWQTMPETVSILYSNFDNLYAESFNPKKLNQLSLILNQVTNLENVIQLSSNFDERIANVMKQSTSERPTFIFSINNVIITNVDNSPGAVVSETRVIIQDARQIAIKIENLSKSPAAHLTIDFFANIDQTNIVTDGWKQDIKQQNNRNSWRIISDDSVPQYATFAANSMTVSTNYHGILEGFFWVYTDTSPTYEYAAQFIFQ